MSIPILLKKRIGSAVTLPASLLPGEPAAFLNTSGAVRLYVGSDLGVPVMVGASDLFLRLAGGTVTGQINGITPTAVANLTRKDYVDGLVATKLDQTTADARYLQLAGGTVTGQINGITPTAAANLTRKDYVDTAVAGRLTQAQGDALYALISHTHVESQITNLNRTRWRGAWAAGSYILNDMVTSGGITYVATADTSAAPPSAAWAVMGAAGAAIKVSDTPPVGPSPGDLWYRSAGSVGLFMWYADGNTNQWISTDQSSAYFSNMLQLAGGTMTGKLTITPNPAIAVGLEMIGTFSGAAIRIPANQAIALDSAGTITMTYDSATNAILFKRSGVTKNTISMV
jgi:hypothetical protein